MTRQQRFQESIPDAPVSSCKRWSQFIHNHEPTYYFVQTEKHSLPWNDVKKQNGGRIVGLAYSLSAKLVFWSDISLGKRGIYRANADSSGNLVNVRNIVSEGQWTHLL